MLKRTAPDTCCQRLARLEAAVQAGGATYSAEWRKAAGVYPQDVLQHAADPAFSCRSVS